MSYNTKVTDNISFFANGILQKKPTKSITTGDFFHLVETGEYASQIEALRQETDQEKQKELKKKLPYITTSGVFDYRSDDKIISHSGLLQVDIDNLPTAEKEILKGLLALDAYFLAVFDSPTNTGLKAIVEIPANVETHRQSFQALEAYILKEYSVQIDTSCKDVSRAMFVSYDKHLHINTENKVFDVLPTQQTTDYEALHKAYTQDFAQVTHQKGERHEDVFSLCVEWVQRKHIFVEKKKSFFRYCLACLLCEFGVYESEALAYISQNYASASGEAKERDDVKSAYKKATANKRKFVPYSEFVAKKDREKVSRGEGTTSPAKQNSYNAPTAKKSLFTIKSMNNILVEGMQKDPLKQMFGEFIKSNEFVIFFGDNGTGKSLCMVQVANDIAHGRNPLGLTNEHAPQKVLYFDFELSDRNFAKRYGNRETGETYNFSENFLRCEMDMQAFADMPANVDYTEELIESIKNAIVSHNAQIIFIDNITGISLKDLGKVENALPLLQKLNALKIEFGITLVVLAHPTKQIDHKPLQKTQLSGSKKLSDLVDSIFAIGKCAYDEDLRYLIDLKNRNGEAIHHKNNVFVMRKFQESAFVGFRYENTTKETLLLLTDEEMEEEKEKIDRDTYIIGLAKEGKSQKFIAQMFNLTQGQISKIIAQNKHQITGNNQSPQGI